MTMTLTVVLAIPITIVMSVTIVVTITMVVVLVVVVVTISYGGENGDDSCGGVSDGMQQKVSLSNVRNVYICAYAF